MKEENLSFLLTLTKKAKNRRIKWNFIKNISQAVLSHVGYCRGHGLGLHLLLRQFHLPSFPDSIGHKSSLPVSPAASSQRHRPAPETVFPAEPSPAFAASTGKANLCPILSGNDGKWNYRSRRCRPKSCPRQYPPWIKAACKIFLIKFHLMRLFFAFFVSVNKKDKFSSFICILTIE